jgi:hypothetical protein
MAAAVQLQTPLDLQAICPKTQCKDAALQGQTAHAAAKPELHKKIVAVAAAAAAAHAAALKHVKLH